MTDDKSTAAFSNEGMFDFRALIKGFLRFKWIILGVTVIAALVSFLITVFILSPQYEASAYVIFTEPIVSTEFETSIEISPTLPDSKTLSDLVESDSIIDSVMNKLNLKDYLKDHPVELDAVLQGNSQLELIVKHKDPEITANFANTWAMICVEHLNELYGQGRDIVPILDNEILKAKEEWNNSQSELEVFLSQSQLEVLEVELSTTKGLLSNLIEKIYYKQRLLSDASTLLRQLNVENSADPLSIPQALSITAIQQRISGDITGTQFLFESGEVFSSEYSVADGMASITGIINAVDEQILEYRDELSDIEQRILDINTELESEKFKLEVITQERDLARSTYIALANQLEEIQINQTQEENPVKIAAPAIIPEIPRKPSVPVNTIFSALAGFFLSITWIILSEWWNQDIK